VAGAGLVLQFTGRSWWLPGTDLPLSAIVAGCILLTGAASLLDTRLGAVAALASLAAAAVFAPPGFHLWGDGALRLRNLEAGIGVLRAAPFEAGDYLLHRLAMILGLSATDSFRAVGLAGGALYLSGLPRISGPSGSGPVPALRMVLCVSPTMMVFFTGYAESYALLAGLTCLAAGALSRGRPWQALAFASAASVMHLAGLLLLPGVAVSALLRGRRATAIVALALLAAIPAALAIVLHRLPHSPALSGADLPGRLSLIVFALPALVMILPSLGGRPRPEVLLTCIISISAFFLLKLERGAAVDWDLGAVLLLPALLLLVTITVDRASVLAPAALAAAALAGPRIGSFLDTGASEVRYLEAVQESPDPAALEELGILQRDRGRFGEAARLFEEAWTLSGNGRHLSQMSEALRLAGDPSAALDAARRAAELRPDVETVWLQLSMAARDDRSVRDAWAAAEKHGSLFPGSPGLWSYALETALDSGDTAAAWRAAGLALSDPDTIPAELINAAGAALSRDSTDLAERWLARASRMDPGNALPVFDLAVIALDRGDTSAASGLLSRAVEIDPGFAPARELRARLP